MYEIYDSTSEHNKQRTLKSFPSTSYPVWFNYAIRSDNHQTVVLCPNSI